MQPVVFYTHFLYNFIEYFVLKVGETYEMSFKKKRKKKLILIPEELELEFADGYVMRKDSTKTKFATTVSYIEARRESLWSTQSSGPSSPIERNVRLCSKISFKPYKI